MCFFEQKRLNNYKVVQPEGFLFLLLSFVKKAGDLKFFFKLFYTLRQKELSFGRPKLRGPL